MQLLTDNKVQVWIERSADYTDTSSFEALLNEDECSRASKFFYDHDRKNFIVAHGFKRKCLAQKLGIDDPSSLRFGKASSGKPYLLDTNIHFNLSHSHGMAALAISPLPCGIDIETYRPINQLPLLVQKTMTMNEQSQIKRAPSQLRAFIDRWVLKEAFLKLSGIGLGLPLASLCTENEIKNLRGSFGMLRGAALFFQRGQDYSLAVSSQELSEFHFHITDGNLFAMQSQQDEFIN